MRIYQLGILFSIICVVALGGNPSEDPIVKLLRERFENGSAPREQDLAVGRNWSCPTSSALDKTFQTTRPWLVFHRLELHLYSAVTWTVPASSSPDFRVGYFITPTELDGRYRDGLTQLFQFVRVDSKRNLILEWARAGIQGVPSVARPDLTVTDYSLCNLTF